MWEGREEGGMGMTLVRRSHFNMETSASLNSGFNVLEALRFLLQLFLFIHDFFFFCILHWKMSLTSPQVPSCSCCAVDPWQTGGFGRFVLTRCCVGDADLGAVLSLCFPFPSAFPTISLCVAKTFALKIHSYTLDVFPVLFWGKKKEEEKKAKQEEKKGCFLWYCISQWAAQVCVLLGGVLLLQSRRKGAGTVLCVGDFCA